jgi:hypothetical protein
MLDKKQQKNLEWNCNLENQSGHGIKNEQNRNTKYSIGTRKHLNILELQHFISRKDWRRGQNYYFAFTNTTTYKQHSQTEFSSKNVKTKSTKSWSVQTHVHGSQIWPVRRHRNRPRATEGNFYNKEQVTSPQQKNWSLLYELKVYSLEKYFIYKWPASIHPQNERQQSCITVARSREPTNRCCFEWLLCALNTDIRTGVTLWLSDCAYYYDYETCQSQTTSI